MCTVRQEFVCHARDELVSPVHVGSRAMSVTLGKVTLAELAESGQNRTSALPRTLTLQTRNFLNKIVKIFLNKFIVKIFQKISKIRKKRLKFLVL